MLLWLQGELGPERLTISCAAALTAATALPEWLRRSWSALLDQALPAAKATSCFCMSLSRQRMAGG